MKKSFVLFVFVMASLCASAQGWTATHFEGDELKGTAETTAYTYTEPGMGSLVIWDNEESLFRLASDNGIFNIITAGNYVGMQIDVGLYDDNDELIEKFKMWLDEQRSSAGKVLQTRPGSSMFIPVGQKKKVKKIMKCLHGGTGYVRFLATRYDEVDFDLRVYPLQ